MVESTENPKFQGLPLDPTLSWHEHIIGLKNIRWQASIYALKCLCELDQHRIHQGYFGLFQANITYGLIVWRSAQEIFILQNKSVQSIVRAARLDLCRDIFNDLKILYLPFYTFGNAYCISQIIWIKLVTEITSSLITHDLTSWLISQTTN